ncbi:dGTP triphosphohydrolase [Cerasicoccus fimbriatus]|uniref:dGTP triphosphohydrolase n=1 Tax=Cerasicoccus fimbriatus TaxID=3014554 RepID=UPI0022B34A7F|nr:dNTP triphosphohydrolase [Cerasicoccus sp. TK19100]
MPDAFYTDFDSAAWGDHGPQPPANDPHRSPYQVDRDRVVFSFAFRRLQSKTQVFQSGEYDFYRTRLTHSLEVARIARSIGEWLRREEMGGQFVDLDLLEAIGLAHDLGHPPYGHIGERKLNELMADYGGFEGNAQTLRILTQLIYERADGATGMSPTRAFLDGVLKYKALRSEETDRLGEPPENHFIYNEQANIRDFVFGGRAAPDGLKLNDFKSIECQIMDWADDTAYSLHDIVDGAKAGFLTVDTVQSWAAGLDDKHAWMADHPKFRDLLANMAANKLEPKFARKVGDFIHACKLEPVENFLSDLTQRHAYTVVIEPEVKQECAIYKKLALDVIFKSTRIQQIEFKGGVILTKLFNALAEHYLPGRVSGRALKLLPEPAHSWTIAADSEAARARYLCDFIASLTDPQAARLYKRLFDPDFGSITDLS